MKGDSGFLRCTQCYWNSYTACSIWLICSRYNCSKEIHMFMEIDNIWTLLTEIADSRCEDAFLFLLDLQMSAQSNLAVSCGSLLVTIP